MEERLQKIIAQAGVSSRRAAESLITGGHVRVNGRVVTELGTKADARNDKIEVDGRRLVAELPVYYVVHKPRGVVSTMSDPEGRPTVATLVKTLKVRVFPVGRLDFATSGVLLMTNDGELSAALLHPRKSVPKTYVLKVQGAMDQDDLDVWRRGVQLEDGLTLPAEVHLLRHEEDKTWIEITLREGRNQQIRRMGDATGFRVMRLARTSFAGIGHEGLRPGEMRPLTRDELMALRDAYGVPKRIRSANASVEQAPGGRREPRRLEAHGARPTRSTRPRPPTPTPTREAREAHGTEEPKKAPPTRPARPPQAPQAAPEARDTRPAREPRRPTAARNDRSETTPRAAPKPAPRARGRGDR
jgi:23S rRNA pseudouridine2605 synthase